MTESLSGMQVIQDSILGSDLKFPLEIKKIKSVAYSSQGSHTGQLDFCNWLADSSTTG